MRCPTKYLSSIRCPLKCLHIYHCCTCTSLPKALALLCLYPHLERRQFGLPRRHCNNQVGKNVQFGRLISGKIFLGGKLGNLGGNLSFLHIKTHSKLQKAWLA